MNGKALATPTSAQNEAYWRQKYLERQSSLER